MTVVFQDLGMQSLSPRKFAVLERLPDEFSRRNLNKYTNVVKEFVVERSVVYIRILHWR